jgi:hypothetical protein
MLFNPMTKAPDLGQLPDFRAAGCEWPELMAVLEDIARLAGELAADKRRHRELSDSEHKARREDDRLLADAIKSGNDEASVGTPHQDALAAEIQRLDRRRSALTVALKDKEAELLAVVAEHGARYAREASERQAEAEGRIEELRAEIARAEAESLAAENALSFVEDPETYKPIRRRRAEREALEREKARARRDRKPITMLAGKGGSGSGIPRSPRAS